MNMFYRVMRPHHCSPFSSQPRPSQKLPGSSSAAPPSSCSSPGTGKFRGWRSLTLDHPTPRPPRQRQTRPKQSGGAVVDDLPKGASAARLRRDCDDGASSSSRRTGRRRSAWKTATRTTRFRESSMRSDLIAETTMPTRTAAAAVLAAAES